MYFPAIPGIESNSALFTLTPKRFFSRMFIRILDRARHLVIAPDTPWVGYFLITIPFPGFGKISLLYLLLIGHRDVCSRAISDIRRKGNRMAALVRSITPLISFFTLHIAFFIYLDR